MYKYNKSAEKIKNQCFIKLFQSIDSIDKTSQLIMQNLKRSAYVKYSLFLHNSIQVSISPNETRIQWVVCNKLMRQKIAFYHLIHSIHLGIEQARQNVHLLLCLYNIDICIWQADLSLLCISNIYEIRIFSVRFTVCRKQL